MKKTNQKTEYNLHDELLKHYAEKSPHAFYQYDAFSDGRQFTDFPFTDPMKRSPYMISMGATHELMDGAQVRVLIQDGLPAEEALRLLKKIRNVIKRDGFSQMEMAMSFQENKIIGKELGVDDGIPF